MANLKVYNGSSWVSARPKIYTGSVWEDAGYFYNNLGNWERLFPTFTNINLSPATSGITRERASAPCWCNIQFNADGIEYSNSVEGLDDLSLSTRGQWLDSGSADQVWIACTINSGSLYQNDASGGRVRCDNSPTFKVRDNTLNAGGPEQANVTFTFYDALSGGNTLATVTYNMEALATTL